MGKIGNQFSLKLPKVDSRLYATLDCDWAIEDCRSHISAWSELNAPGPQRPPEQTETDAIKLANLMSGKVDGVKHTSMFWSTKLALIVQTQRSTIPGGRTKSVTTRLAPELLEARLT